MALPPSGSAISLSQVNTELGRSATATIDMNDSALRSLFQKTGSGTTISMSDGWGKSAVTISLSSVTSNEPFAATPYAGGEPSTAELNFLSNGTWSATLEASAGKSGNWATPTTTGVGSGYWIRFTRTFFSGGAGNSATGTTGWLQLNTTQGVFVQRTSGFGVTTADYTIEISTNSGGSNIVATASLITLTAEYY
jgi:hypothetical protein